MKLKIISKDYFILILLDIHFTYVLWSFMLYIMHIQSLIFEILIKKFQYYILQKIKMIHIKTKIK